MTKLIIEDDSIDYAQKLLDEIVRQGAAQATTIVTYPDGQQLVIKSNSKSDTFSIRLAAAFL